MKLLPHLSSSILLTFWTLTIKKNVYSLLFHSLFMRQRRVCRDANRQPSALSWRMLQVLQCILLRTHCQVEEKCASACDNLLCGKCTVSEEERSGRVGSYCFACEKHMCNQCFFEDAFVGCQDCGIVLCRKWKFIICPHI
jgi:hypothetical protein